MTGLLGGGTFLSLDSSLFWLVALMLAGNAREDYFDEIEENGDSAGALKNSACISFFGENNNNSLLSKDLIMNMVFQGMFISKIIRVFILTFD